ncbi:YbaK/EbsC family protein [Streptomyces acidiscabies]|uniref:YbaK/prolyl-tRNA synthetase associated protein n=1 Tax=Streptomyces acidiscabies TaxID=42234 RepID=A0A0L0KNP5_9ACTN|nr:YbaK/EbsC family protein [Streptomyces acidiscabies]KND39210.1 YbaK/prolyl-tRNA synthetase associated protein [Streptomyces acidiscabies]
MTTTDAHPLFAQALQEMGLDEVLGQVRTYPDGARTAAEAADAVGCELGQICKSLIFAADGVPVLVLVDGASRVDVAAVSGVLGVKKVTRADVKVVRDVTGYAIGGVPPFGHRTRMRVLADRGLLVHDEVWAAAGNPHAVFPMPPKELVRHAQATLVDVRELTS